MLPTSSCTWVYGCSVDLWMLFQQHGWRHHKRAVVYRCSQESPKYQQKMQDTQAAMLRKAAVALEIRVSCFLKFYSPSHAPE